MWTYICLTTVICFLIGLVIVLARREGKKSAKLEALKAEAKRNAEEQRREQQVTNAVYALSDDDARRRLHEVSNKQR